MASTINFANHVKRFSETMRSMQRILYVGTKCNLQNFPALVGKTWRCIYTANRSSSLADLFCNTHRQVRAITSISDYQKETTKLDSANPMVIYLNGRADSEERPDDLGVKIEQDRQRKALIDTLKRTLKSVSMVELVIVGYDPNNEDEIRPMDLADIASELSDKQITIYGLSPEDENNRYIKYLEEKDCLTVFSQDLGEALEEESERIRLENEEEGPVFEIDEGAPTVFINDIPKPIDISLYNQFCKFGRVLTIKEMKTTRISRSLEVEYFYKFLKQSPISPQWYGYTKQNDYAVKRDFEEPLYKAVIEGLENNNEAPIALAGQSGSGKSIALARLAYRIFQEKKYPVIFITNPDIVFSMNTTAGVSLDNLLKEIRDLDGRALVILDWSQYSLQKSVSVRRISDLYHGRGHNVLFVVSTQNAAKADKKLYQVIETPSKISDQDKKAFKNLMINKAKLQGRQVDGWFNDNSEKPGLLSMMYQLLYELRPQLERGIKREISGALQDTRQELNDLPAPVRRQPLTELAEKLIAAGIVKISDKSTEEESKEAKKRILDGLQPFCESVAVATLFKLRMPLTLALKLLNIPECENRNAYCKVVFNAPWIHAAMDDDKYAPGEYYVTFRDPMDARIYLNSLGKTEEAQMEIVANTIAAIDCDSYYGEEVSFLERLIRMVGPNNNTTDSPDEWFYSYGRGCTKVIGALQELRNNGIIEPQLVVQEITYLREYYSKTADMDLSGQIHQLEEAIHIAQEVKETIDQDKERSIYVQQGLIDSITNESIFSEIRLEDRIAQAKLQNIAIEVSDRIKLHSFSERKDILMEIIERQPENSYAYTGLLASFLSKYEQRSVQGNVNEMLSDMSDVLAVVDITETSIPVVEQNEFYQNYKQRFLTVFDRVYSTERADTYFEQLLQMGSPVGIHMKARAILRQANVDYNTKLTGQAEIEACDKALSVLKDERYAPVIRSHPASQFLRLQLTWLKHNKKPIFAGERQTTSMTVEEWTELYNICCSFSDNISESHYKATVYYIMALSCAQLSDYDRAVNFWKEIQEEDIHDSRRQHTWHIISQPDGTPKVFNGTFNRPSLPERRIFVKEMNRSVLYPSLQSINKDSARGDAPNLCVGTSYRGFSVYAVNRLQNRG